MMKIGDRFKDKATGKLYGEWKLIARRFAIYISSCSHAARTFKWQQPRLQLQIE
jgi:hypothetical protein